MSRSKPFATLAGILLLIVAAAHLLRILGGWKVTIDDTSIPMWASWAAVVLAGSLGALLVRR